MDATLSYKKISAGWRYLLFETVFLPPILSLILQLVFRCTDSAILNFAYFSVNFTAVAVLFRQFWADSFRALPNKLPAVVGKAALALGISKLAELALAWLSYSLLPQYYILSDLAPRLINLNDQAIYGMLDQHFLLIAIGTVILVPPAEEMLYRGVMFRSLRGRFPRLSYVFSALLFALVHVMGYLSCGDIVYIALMLSQYLIPGLILARLYAGTGSIFAPIAMHIAYNALAILLSR